MSSSFHICLVLTFLMLLDDTKLLYGTSEFSLTHQDKDGDWMLVAECAMGACMLVFGFDEEEYIQNCIEIEFLAINYNVREHCKEITDHEDLQCQRPRGLKNWLELYEDLLREHIHMSVRVVVNSSDLKSNTVREYYIENEGSDGMRFGFKYFLIYLGKVSCILVYLYIYMWFTCIYMFWIFKILYKNQIFWFIWICVGCLRCTKVYLLI